MAKENNIDLKDPRVIEEFKIIQEQTLNDIKRMKEGKKPLSEEELKEERGKILQERHEKQIKEEIAKRQKEKKEAESKTEKLV